MAVERDVEMPGVVVPDGCRYPTWRESVGQQRVVRMVLMEPLHDFVRLRVQDELAALQSDRRSSRDASAFHDSLNVGEWQVFDRLLPDVAMLAARLASGSRIDHQLRK